MTKKFNWKKFHKDLDYAVAQFIILDSQSGIKSIRLPSKTTLMTFMKFSKQKMDEQNGN